MCLHGLCTVSSLKGCLLPPPSQGTCGHRTGWPTPSGPCWAPEACIVVTRNPRSGSLGRGAEVGPHSAPFSSTRLPPPGWLGAGARLGKPRLVFLPAGNLRSGSLGKKFGDVFSSGLSWERVLTLGGPRSTVASRSLSAPPDFGRVGWGAHTSDVGWRIGHCGNVCRPESCRLSRWHRPLLRSVPGQPATWVCPASCSQGPPAGLAMGQDRAGSQDPGTCTGPAPVPRSELGR